jgi:hypothetical protein
MSIELLSEGNNNNTWWFYNWEVFLGEAKALSAAYFKRKI